ncbi:sigma-70 family RNA polymerase sigma factor [Aliifodinibius salicampi]|uniref:Sigma-70 family RNA polymerase sigma factor n=1 Tax=Fodinibius salicampi TaxID=1920655 RepID=A0ABT3PWU9_9BACT|nr:sigma-70 family RNA polymerase sigma factor [Fodinibius salicampi]MCW9712339.1 sigma-70 family RNA polymerase sigma factor [Fodinibius salicampi]
MDNSKGNREVWEQFIRGEESCFKALFDRYYKPMYGYGIKLCDRPELVKDCIQELFRNIWERRDALTHIESPRVYLFVSLRRKILKKIKAHRKTDSDLEEVDEADFIQFDKEELIIRDEVKFQQKKKLRLALNQLSDRQREVIYLHYYNGMSYGEIEQILSINRQSVRNHIYRAMETLRSLLDTEIMKLVISLLLSFLWFV